MTWSNGLNLSVVLPRTDRSEGEMSCGQIGSVDRLYFRSGCHDCVVVLSPQEAGFKIYPNYHNSYPDWPVIHLPCNHGSRFTHRGFVSLKSGCRLFSFVLHPMALLVDSGRC